MKIPSSFQKRYCEFLADEAPAFFDAFKAEALAGFHVNTTKPNWDRFTKTLTEQYEPAPFAPHSYFGQISGKTPAHQAGYVYSQEPSASLVGTVAAAKPGERVLDLCAAPGGKTSELAMAMQDSGLLVANDINPKRAEILSENVERLGFTHTIVTNNSPAQLAQALPGYFDRVLVDAPCSGEGMFRKNPEAIGEWTADTPAACAARQADIVADAVTLVRPGGRLIYSTCTFAPEENEAIVSQLVERYGLVIDTIDLTGIPHASGRAAWGTVPGLERTVRIWPHKQPGEGHFVARLVKPADASTAKKTKPFRPTQPTREQQQQLFAAFTQKFPLENTLAPGLVPHVKGDALYFIPENTPAAVAKLRRRRFGLAVGRFKKNRFEPSFALALALHPNQKTPTVAISYDEWVQYVHGDTFKTEAAPGWTLLTYAGMPVGFGKSANHIMKNFYPKGLRFAV